MLGSLFTYLKYISILLGIILPVIYLIRRNPDLAFWLLLNISFDPGGYFLYYFERLSFFYLYDLTILPIIFCLFSINANYKIIYKDRFFINFLKIFSIFVIYYFVVYGGIVPFLNNDFNYLVFLQKNRTFFYYIIYLISAYIFALRGLKYFYFSTLFIGIFVLGTLLISLVTHFNITPVVFEERYEGEEMMRIGLYSWGLFSILFHLSFILFLFSRKIKLNIKYKKVAYIAGLLMAFVLLIALSRRNFISIPGTILIIILLNSYIFRQSKAFSFAKLLIPLGLLLILINFALPKYVDYIASISQDTFQLLFTGSDTRGEGEYRVSGTGDLEISKKYISDNFILGTGYSYLYFGAGDITSSRGSMYAKAMHASAEVPIYYIFFGYGLLGFILMIFLYSYLIRLFLKLYTVIKKKINLLTEYPYEILFVIFILFMIADKFTFSLYSLGRDFTVPSSAVFIGIGFALLRKLKIITSNIEMSAPYKTNRLKELDTSQTFRT